MAQSKKFNEKILDEYFNRIDWDRLKLHDSDIPTWMNKARNEGIEFKYDKFYAFIVVDNHRSYAESAFSKKLKTELWIADKLKFYTE